MKTHSIRTLLGLLPVCILISVVMIVSCQKTQDTSVPQTDTQLNTDLMNSTNFVYEGSSLDREDFTDAIGNGGSSNLHGPEGDDCRTVTYKPSQDVYPHTKTITSDNCVKCDGSTVNGVKMITYYVDPESAKPGDLLSKKTYRNYTVGEDKIMGTVTTYLVSSDPYVLHVVAEKTIIEPGSDGGKRTYTSDNTWTRIAGGNTNDESDDVYSIQGSSSGTENLHGSGYVASFTSVIDPNDPVINSNECCWNTQGTITVTINVKSHGGYILNEALDYGDGTCDDEATLSINGDEGHTVTLPLRFFPLAMDSNP